MESLSVLDASCCVGFQLQYRKTILWRIGACLWLPLLVSQTIRCGGRKEEDGRVMKEGERYVLDAFPVTRVLLRLIKKT